MDESIASDSRDHITAGLISEMHVHGGIVQFNDSNVIGRQNVPESLKIVNKKNIWFDVKDPVELFTGREQELRDLKSKVQRNSEKVTVISQMTSVSGLGGIGKSELARKYVYENRQDYDGNIIWINAEKYENMVESFMKLARDKRLDVPTKNKDGKEKTVELIVEEIYGFFGKKKSLFIFDNAERNEDLNKFLPTRSLTPDAKKPYILITSRNQEWDRGIEVLNLNEFKLEDAIKFVKKGLNIPKEDILQDQEIENLVRKLQCFPLAIQQAISYIEDQRITGEFEFSDYLREYEKKTKDLLKSELFRGIDNDYAKTTFTTWQITIDRIRSDKQYGQLALEILDTIAYFASESINREIFLNLAGGNEEQLKSAVRLIVKYSMVNGERKQSVLNIHRLVQEVTRLELKGKGKEKETLKKALELVEKNMKKENIDHSVSAWDHASKNEELVKEFSSLPIQIIIKLNENIRYEEAYLFGIKALELLKSILGLSHPDTLRTRNNIAGVFDNQGKYDEALEAYQEIFDKRKQILGPDHPNTLRTRNNIAGVIYKQGKYDEALEAYQEICEKRNDNMTPLHLVVQNGFKELVKLLLAKGSDVLARNSHDTVLHRAVSGGNEGIIRLILDKIKEKFSQEPQQVLENVNAPDTEGDTPLMWAAEKGKVSAAQILLEYGANINAIDKDGMTALHFATDGGHLEFVQLLLDHNADPTIEDKDRKTPLDLAREKLVEKTDNEKFGTIVVLLLSINNTKFI